MTDRPILFSGPMVRAILDGRKTQTRRVLKPQPDYRGGYGDRHDAEEWGWEDECGYHVSVLDIAPNGYRAGDRLWVRETWRASKDYNAYPPRELSHWPVHYEADGDPDPRDDLGLNGRLRPSIHMPRWASRLTLTVTDVRVQRVQEISKEDARGEGAAYWWQRLPVEEREPTFTAIGMFRSLWDTLNAKRDYGWERNPWVVALTFRALKENIDRLEGAS